MVLKAISRLVSVCRRAVRFPTKSDPVPASARIIPHILSDGEIARKEQKRRTRPYIPSLTRAPESVALIPEGATGCASGSQSPMGRRPALVANPKKKRKMMPLARKGRALNIAERVCRMASNENEPDVLQSNSAAAAMQSVAPWVMMKYFRPARWLAAFSLSNVTRKYEVSVIDSQKMRKNRKSVHTRTHISW